MLSPVQMDRLVRAALEEDLGAGDLTTELLLAGDDPGARASIRAREDLVLAGLPVAERAFRLLDPEVSFRALREDGARLRDGEAIAEVEGRACVLLAGERTALNFLCRLSGIATLTSRYLEAMGGTGAKLLSTRKTTPGHRLLETWAVAVGGGTVHRRSLGDGVLIKDNHVALAGGVAEAVRRVRERAGPARAVEVEVSDVAGLEEAIAAGADVALLDNFEPAALRAAVAAAAGRIRLEASGGVTLANVAEVAASGVDAVSVGRLTHSAPAADIHMKFEGPPAGG